MHGPLPLVLGLAPCATQPLDGPISLIVFPFEIFSLLRLDFILTGYELSLFVMSFNGFSFVILWLIDIASCAEVIAVTLSRDCGMR